MSKQKEPLRELVGPLTTNGNSITVDDSGKVEVLSDYFSSCEAECNTVNLLLRLLALIRSDHFASPLLGSARSQYW